MWYAPPPKKTVIPPTYSSATIGGGQTAINKNETNVKAPENFREEDLVKSGWSQEDLSVAYKEALV